MEKFLLERVYLPTETLGSIYAPDKEIVCKTMELPWKENRSNISCIPEGEHLVRKMVPDQFRKYPYFRFVKVEGRGINKFYNMSTILIHPATFVHHLKGCIGVGSKHTDINKDGIPDIVDSKLTLKHMTDTMPDEFILDIKRKE